MAGIDLNQARVRHVAEALVSLSPKPEGFTVGDLAAQVRALTGWSIKDYSARRAYYDLNKFRGKNLVQLKPQSRRYLVSPKAVRQLCGFVILREKVIKPLLAGCQWNQLPPSPEIPHPLDRHYLNLCLELRRTFHTLGFGV